MCSYLYANKGNNGNRDKHSITVQRSLLLLGVCKTSEIIAEQSIGEKNAVGTFSLPHLESFFFVE